MSRLQLIIVLETNSENGTDSLYFHAVLRNYFQTRDLNDSEVNIRYIYLNGKMNYKDEEILKKVNNYSSMFNDWEDNQGETKVIYCIDTDSSEKEYKVGSFFKNVQLFCEEKGFELIWFCKNAENVFLGVEPDTLDSKLDSAIDFVAQNKIAKIDYNVLCKDNISIGCSNIVTILKKYLKLK